MGAMVSQITSLTIVYSTVYTSRSRKTSKLRITGLCEGNSPVTGEFPAQMASNAENVFHLIMSSWKINVSISSTFWHFCYCDIIWWTKQYVKSFIYFEEIKSDFCINSCGCWWPSPVEDMSSVGTVMTECAMEVYGMAWLTLDGERLMY